MTGYVTCCLTERRKFGLRVCENRVFRKVFEAKGVEVTGEWRKLQNEEFHGL